MIEQRIYRHRGYTLIDITKTDVTKFTPELERMRNKQRNWETVVQILGLRTQIMRINQLKTETKDLSQHAFGSDYQDKQRVWTFEFEVEFELSDMGEETLETESDIIFEFISSIC